MRTHYNKEINKRLLHQTVNICGWVHRKRHHGKLAFIDLRDSTGILQVLCDPENLKDFKKINSIRGESVLRIAGIVRDRPQVNNNPSIETGNFELVALEIEILNRSETIPFNVTEKSNVNEEIRLRYRYIDLRRKRMAENIIRRSMINSFLRRFLEKSGFIDIETPILTKPTPEGARDYLVPSRSRKGCFYGLPQSPQIFKQLLMVAGFDKYYQIARCFRDEDLRSDRQAEFTQLDMELSFVSEEDIITLTESMIKSVFSEFLKEKLITPFPRISYYDSMNRFGTDKPDLRIPIEIVDLTSLSQYTKYSPFIEAASTKGHKVAGIKIESGCGRISRKKIEEYTKIAVELGTNGFSYIKFNTTVKEANGVQSSILKLISNEFIERVADTTKAKESDMIFITSGKTETVNELLGKLRLQIASELNILNPGWNPIWVVDFPMFEQGEEGSLEAVHHPFTAPKFEKNEEKISEKPLSFLSRSYDIVLNGNEIGGGSIRIDKVDIQNTVFDLLKIDELEAKKKFGCLIDALQYGCPPHGGIAIGLDRLISIMFDTDTIRDIIAFPKTQSGSCLLTGAPSTVDQEQLSDLGIEVEKNSKTSILNN